MPPLPKSKGDVTQQTVIVANQPTTYAVKAGHLAALFKGRGIGSLPDVSRVATITRASTDAEAGKFLPHDVHQSICEAVLVFHRF